MKKDGLWSVMKSPVETGPCSVTRYKAVSEPEDGKPCPRYALAI